MAITIANNFSLLLNLLQNHPEFWAYTVASYRHDFLPNSLMSVGWGYVQCTGLEIASGPLKAVSLLMDILVTPKKLETEPRPADASTQWFTALWLRRLYLPAQDFRVYTEAIARKLHLCPGNHQYLADSFVEKAPKFMFCVLTNIMMMFVEDLHCAWHHP